MRRLLASLALIGLLASPAMADDGVFFEQGYGNGFVKKEVLVDLFGPDVGTQPGAAEVEFELREQSLWHTKKCWLTGTQNPKIIEPQTKTIVRIRDIYSDVFTYGGYAASCTATSGCGEIKGWKLEGYTGPGGFDKGTFCRKGWRAFSKSTNVGWKDMRLMATFRGDTKEILRRSMNPESAGVAGH